MKDKINRLSGAVSCEHTGKRKTSSTRSCSSISCRRCRSRQRSLFDESICGLDFVRFRCTTIQIEMLGRSASFSYFLEVLIHSWQSFTILLRFFPQ